MNPQLLHYYCYLLNLGSSDQLMHCFNVASELPHLLEFPIQNFLRFLDCVSRRESHLAVKLTPSNVVQSRRRPSRRIRQMSRKKMAEKSNRLLVGRGTPARIWNSPSKARTGNL